MNILDKIVAHKKREVETRRELYPTRLLEQSIYYQTQAVSLVKYLLREDKTGIIAEFKRRSPSKGDINPYATVESVSIGYMQAGASALSVLTDEPFFGGRNADLTEARKFNFCPILRKDFVIDPYQVIEARSIGADVVLLIAECLDKAKLRELATLAKSLGLEVLMEVHSIGQLDKLCPEVDLVGVNNRNLEDFSVDVGTSFELAEAIPAPFIKVSESGISAAETIVDLRQAGFRGFLIGEHFMNTAHPSRTCAQMIQEIQGLRGRLVEQT